MRILDRLDISGSMNLASNAKDQFFIGTPLENNDGNVDDLLVYANADFKNNVILGSSSLDTITANGQISASAGISASVYYGDGSNLTNVGAVQANGITVQETGSGATANVSGVTTLKFDKDTGFNVEDVGGNAVKISLGSTFKTWNVSGSDSLVAVGEDTVEFIAGNNITITTNANSNPKSITFNAVTGSGGGISEVFTTGNITGSGTQVNPIVLKDNISLSSVTASFSGDGTNVTGVLTSSYSTNANLAQTASYVDIVNLPNFATNVRNQLASGDNINYSNGQFSLNNDVNVSNITASAARITGDTYIIGTLNVEGNINAVNRTQLFIEDNVILIASGTSDENLLDGTGIHFGTVPNENISIVYESTENCFIASPALSSSFLGDGTNLLGLPYDFFGEVYGKPVANEVIFRIVAPRSFQLNTSGHYFYAVTGSASTANFVIRKNGIQIGTASYASSTTATVSGITTNNNAFVAGDILSITAPASQDANISDLYFTLKANTN